MVVDDFLEQGYPLKTILKILGMPRSTYYYKPTGTKAGKRRTNTFYRDESPVSKDVLLEDIKDLLAEEFVDYGYYKTYIHLKNELNYAIGSTRTYRIMKENDLLKFQRNKKKRKNRNWVKDLVPKVEHPFTFLEFDIKFAYIQGTRTNVMVLTVLDVFSRWNLGHYISYSIKKEDVIELFENIKTEFQMPEQFIVRNDNGSQFIASQVQEWFVKNDVTQEFTKPSTPEQNAHIESYHSIMESAVCQRFEFENKEDFIETMDRFRDFYNFKRIHGGIGHKSPAKFLRSKGIEMEKKHVKKTIN